MMKSKILFILLLSFISVFVYSQNTYTPGLHTTLPKPLGPSTPMPTDARSWYYDPALFKYRPYNGISEVISYLNQQRYRIGGFPIFVNESGTLQTNGSYIDSSVNIYWFKNGTSNASLENFFPKQVFDKLSDVRNIKLDPYTLIYIDGFWEKGDGGGGYFIVDPNILTIPSIDTGMLYPIANKIIRRIYDGLYVRPEWFGVIGYKTFNTFYRNAANTGDSINPYGYKTVTRYRLGSTTSSPVVPDRTNLFQRCIDYAQKSCKVVKLNAFNYFAKELGIPNIWFIGSGTGGTGADQSLVATQLIQFPNSNVDFIRSKSNEQLGTKRDNDRRIAHMVLRSNNGNSTGSIISYKDFLVPTDNVSASGANNILEDLKLVEAPLDGIHLTVSAVPLTIQRITILNPGRYGVYTEDGFYAAHLTLRDISIDGAAANEAISLGFRGNSVVNLDVIRIEASPNYSYPYQAGALRGGLNGIGIRNCDDSTYISIKNVMAGNANDSLGGVISGPIRNMDAAITVSSTNDNEIPYIIYENIGFQNKSGNDGIGKMYTLWDTRKNIIVKREITNGNYSGNGKYYEGHAGIAKIGLGGNGLVEFNTTHSGLQLTDETLTGIYFSESSLALGLRYSAIIKQNGSLRFSTYTPLEVENIGFELKKASISSVPKLIVRVPLITKGQNSYIDTVPVISNTLTVTSSSINVYSETSQTVSQIIGDTEPGQDLTIFILSNGFTFNNGTGTNNIRFKNGSNYSPAINTIIDLKRANDGSWYER